MRRILFATFLLAALFCASSQAAPILSGTFSTAGTITVFNGGVPGCAAAGGCITWADPTGTIPNRADISAVGLTGVFAGIAGFSGNAQANVTNLVNPPEVVGPPGFAPQPFMSFCATTPCVPPVTTTLLVNFIPNGIFPPTQCGPPPSVGQVCTTPGSLFNFVNNPGGPSAPNGQATATWVLNGVTNDGQSSWTGNFTAQFGVPFQTVFAQLAATGSVSNTYSATFTVTQITIPEAGTMSMLGLGLVVFSTLLRRKSRKI